MATFCLTKQTIEKFKKALKDREIDPFKMAEMTSEQRRGLLEKYVGEHAKDVNALFESKLLLKNQKAGYQTWVKKVAGISKEAKRDLISRIERLEKVLTPTEERAFLQDLASTRLGVNITEVEGQIISDLSKRTTEGKSKMNEDFTWDSRKDEIEYTSARVALEDYVKSLKGNPDKAYIINPLWNTERMGFFEANRNNLGVVIRGIADNSRAFKASFDNSLWGNQGIRVMLDPRYTRIWAKNFAQSFRDIAQVLVKGKTAGDEILSAVRADIYGRKNSLNGRYEMNTKDTSKLAINTGEEEFPTSLPSRIPVLGRLFKASEIAYEAGAMRLRADIADKVYAMAELNQMNMNDKEVVGSYNILINSMTGRGKFGMSDQSGKLINSALFSVRFLKSNIDFLTFNAVDKIDARVRKESAMHTLRVLATTAVLLGIAKSLDDDSVELDPRSSDFGKIKIGNTRFSVAPYASIITLMSRILTNSSKSTSTKEVTQLGERYGVPDGMDVFWDFTENKASPMFAALRDLIRRRTFDGEKPTFVSTIKDLTVPMGINTVREIVQDTSSNALLDAIAIALNFTGINANTFPGSNESSKLIPKNKKISEDNFVELVSLYGEAFGADPETTFNRIFSGQRVVQVSDGGIVVVERQPVEDSQIYKKQVHKGDVKEVRLDHTIPNKLGGAEDKSNWKVVPKSLWQSYTSTENALIKAVKEEKLELKEAQKEIVKFKSIKDKKERDAYGEKLRQKYK